MDFGNNIAKFANIQVQLICCLGFQWGRGVIVKLMNDEKNAIWATLYVHIYPKRIRMGEIIERLGISLQ